MILVTFHGGTPATDQVYAYHTKTKKILSREALEQPATGGLSELRSMVEANGFLYVVSGGKSVSTVLCFRRDDGVSGSGAAGGAPLFRFVSTVIGPTLSGKQFTTAIGHPFGVAFDKDSECYVSNQDTNVVAKLRLQNGGQRGSLGTGCRSAYLSQLFPPPAIFLDGTFVASQDGALPDVDITATSVPASDGGLGLAWAATEPAAARSKDKQKIQNSVRDVAVANGCLFVCDEVDETVNVYSVADGTFLGAAAVAGKPTHLALHNGGVFVSAGGKLCWGQLPESASAKFTLTTVALSPPTIDGKATTIGGLGFDDDSSTVYVPFQLGTGGTGKGEIWSYAVDQSNPSVLPILNSGEVFAGSLPDTPEFVCHVQG